MLFIFEPDQSTVRAAITELSAAVSVIPVQAFAVPYVHITPAIASMDTEFFMLVSFWFRFIVIIFFNVVQNHRKECVGAAYSIFYLQNGIGGYIISAPWGIV